MGTDWDINPDKPEKVEKYKWRLPANDQQHVEETVAPGDLQIKPRDISLVPTNAPKQSGVQSGWSDWSYESVPDSSWYVRGEILQE
jgi:hypothetical protein